MEVTKVTNATRVFKIGEVETQMVNSRLSSDLPARAKLPSSN
jgi:hypothetical protein